MPHVLGDNGEIVAIFWVSHHPLVVPAIEGRNNKILWVARSPASPLKVQATLAGSSQTVTQTLADGPGPSTIDLPVAGCWSFDLSWGNHHDRLRLSYAPS
jgi:hypothetical protein